MYVEKRTISDLHTRGLAWYIANHLYTRQFEGTVLIVADEPPIVLGALRKQWIRLIRLVQRERARTLNAANIKELSRVIARMQQLVFVTKPPLQRPDAHIFLLKPAELSLLTPGQFTTIYVACDSTEALIQKLKILTTKDGLLVLHEAQNPSGQ